ncbi:MAG: hypothetical protein VX346_03050 [Planctomycetota bacterium]|nr:hypothetical protein [Planctomycetota bacterium]
MTQRGRRILVSTLGIVLLAGVVLAVNLVYPRCENCGRRYGPLLPHLYRHPTTRQSGQNRSPRWTGKSVAETVRQAATAPVSNELPPLTDANRQLTLSRELLVGVWESQDGTRNPLHFHADGSVAVGFIKEAGKWVMSAGQFAIESGRVVTRTNHKGARLALSFRFARGVLYAPHGPSPQVVWRKMSALPGQQSP